MLNNRSMYIWHLTSAVPHGDVAGAIAKAKDAKLSHMVPKIGDGTAPFENVEGATAHLLEQLVTLGKAEAIDVFGYHVPHCATSDDARAEAEFVAATLEHFGLAGVFIDNEDGGPYFRGDANTAHVYATELQARLSGTGRDIVMSSHDVVSAHPKAYASIIGQVMTVNAPQVYYGGSPTVDGRLQRAVKENAAFAAPFAPIGAAFVSAPGANDGGCSSAAECGARALAFIKLVSLLHESNPTKFQGYGFWNWEEAPAEVWDVLRQTPVFTPDDHPALNP